MNIVHGVVFFDEFFGYVAQFDAGILRSVQRWLVVEVFNVKSDKLGALTGKGAVEQKLDEVEGSGQSSDVARTSDVLDCDSDMSAIGIRIIGAKSTNIL